MFQFLAFVSRHHNYYLLIAITIFKNYWCLGVNFRKKFLTLYFLTSRSHGEWNPNSSHGALASPSLWSLDLLPCLIFLCPNTLNTRSPLAWASKQTSFHFNPPLVTDWGAHPSSNYHSVYGVVLLHTVLHCRPSCGPRLRLKLAPGNTMVGSLVPGIHSLHYNLILLALHHVISKHSMEVRDGGC